MKLLRPFSSRGRRAPWLGSSNITRTIQALAGPDGLLNAATEALLIQLVMAFVFSYQLFGNTLNVKRNVPCGCKRESAMHANGGLWSKV